VVEPGDIRACDPVEIVHRPDHNVTVALVFRAMTLEPDLLPRLQGADAPFEETWELLRRRTTR
jgi:MOSC domain-containing protein YiiM